MYPGFPIRRENGGTWGIPPIRKFFQKAPPHVPPIFFQNIFNKIQKKLFKAWNKVQTTPRGLNSHNDITLPSTSHF